jgi:hypothetical protein
MSLLLLPSIVAMNWFLVEPTDERARACNVLHNRVSEEARRRVGSKADARMKDIWGCMVK